MDVPLPSIVALTGILTEQKFIPDCRYRIIERSSIVPVLLEKCLDIPLLVNGFSDTCFRTFFS